MADHEQGPDRTHLEALRELTDRLQHGAPLTPEALAKLFKHVSASLADALNYANRQVAEGISEVRQARARLLSESMDREAQELDPLLQELGAASTQIQAGLKMSRETWPPEEPEEEAPSGKPRPSP